MKRLLAVCLASLSSAAFAADDYIGVLKVPSTVATPGVSTFSTLPWRGMSLYGSLGVGRMERPLGIEALPGNPRWRYGLGVKYDFTSAFGVRAEFERAPVLPRSSLSPDLEADQLSVGVRWRF